MEFYTLNSRFGKEVLIDEFESAIWTERFTPVGDVKLVIPATRERVKQLATGTFLALKGSKEIMMLDTQVIENGMLTVTGNTLEDFLNQRYIGPGTTVITSGEGSSRPPIRIRSTPGRIIMLVVRQMTIQGHIPSTPEINFLDYTSPLPLNGFWDGPFEGNEQRLDVGNTNIETVIENNYMDISGPKITHSFQPGSIYPQILSLAESYGVGMSLRLKYDPLTYLESGIEDQYLLEFITYKGKDRTKSQTENELLRFSPELDSLVNIKELRSIKNYKTVAYAWAPNSLRAKFPAPGSAAIPGLGAQSPWYKHRILSFVVNENEIIPDAMSGDTDVPSSGGDTGAQKVSYILEEKAKAALVKHNRTKVVDGEIVPRVDIIFGKHYKLGDIVELEGYTGAISKVIVTEYIRSQDETGERAYPTVAPYDPPPVDLASSFSS